MSDTLRLTPVKYRVSDSAEEEAEVRESEAVFIEQRGVQAHWGEKDGAMRWAIVSGFSTVFSKHGVWEWEPQPSSRTEEFLARTRFVSPEEALAVLDLYGGMH
jgi:hypothetical protein